MTEYRGEMKSQRKVKNVHIIDGFTLGGEDISNKHFMERHELLKTFLHTMNKNSRTEFVKLRLKDVYKLDDLSHLYNNCNMKILKGKMVPSLVHELNEVEADGVARYFQPSGVMFIKTVREPFIMALSRSQNRKYWFNTVTREAKFEMPVESVAGSCDGHVSRLVWWWDTCTGIHPGQSQLASGQQSRGVTREDMDRFITKLKS